jgi:hypothetical protein
VLLTPKKLKNLLVGRINKKPHGIGTVQIQVLNWLSQEVLSRKPSQQFEYPIKGVLSSKSRDALEEKDQSDQSLANRRLKD